MKRLDFNTVLATSIATLAFAVCAVAPTAAAGNGAVGSWSVVDRGPGCWGGGSLFAGGSVGGGGECAFPGQGGAEVAKLVPVSWSFTDSTDTAVTLNANIVGQKGPVFPVGVPVPVSVTVPVGGKAPLPDGQGDYAKVNIF